MYDLLIIGGGPAGYAAAVRASQLGARVLMAEKEKVGGTCLHNGCIPAKVLQEFARTVTAARQVVEGPFQLRTNILAGRQKAVVSELYNGLLQVLNSNRLELVQGTATLGEPGKVTVENEDGKNEYRAKRILIATGAKEIVPAFDGGALLRSVSESLLPPAECCRVAIIGGGNTGLELASAYAALGFTVTVIEKEAYLLPALGDQEMRKWLGFLFRRRGIAVYTATQVKNIYRKDKAVHLALTSSTGESEVVADVAVAALGRVPNLDKLEKSLAAALAKNEFGAIQVNEHLETNIPGIYAAGDVTGPPMLAHAAYAEGFMAAENALGYSRTASLRPVPHILDAEPQAAWVGLTESEAAHAGLHCRTGTFPFAANGCARVHGKDEGYVKVVALEKDDTVVGMQILGGRAGELIMEGVLAVQNRLKVRDLAQAIHPHPTYSEAVWEAALALEGSGLHGPHKILK